MGGGRGGGRLRYQVLLRLLALEEFGLGARHVDVCGVGAVIQEVVEGVEVVRLWDGGVEQEDTGGKKIFSGFTLFNKSNLSIKGTVHLKSHRHLFQLHIFKYDGTNFCTEI